MSPNAAPARLSAGRRAVRGHGLIIAVLALLLAACSPATTPAPRATITFLVQNQTGSEATYRFEGSATVADVTGPLDCMAQTPVGTTWDPTWTFLINDQRVIGSTDSTDLQPGAGSHQALTVIIVLDQGGVRSTVHAGPPLAGEVETPAPSPVPSRSCTPAPGTSPAAPSGSPGAGPSASPIPSPS
jgi:hypothetical protein